MRAAVLVEQKKPLEVVDLEMPDELQFGQVKVKIFYSGICGAQINEIDGVKGPDKWIPHLLGHEASGEVLEAGPGVTTVKAGDTVVMHWRPSPGIQAPTPKYKWGEKTVNAGWVTTFCDEAIISENRLTVIPKGFDLRIAPLFGCAVTTAMGVVNNDAKIKIGQSVLVLGIGGVGLNIVQMADAVSASPIIGVDLFDHKLDWGRKYGMTHGFNSSKEKDIESKVREIVGDKGPDVVIDTTGNPRVIEMAYNLTHPDGKTILVGVPRKGENVSIYTLPLHFRKVLTGSEGGSCQPHLDIPRAVKLTESNKLKFDELITHEFPLDQINEAIDVVRSGDAGRVLINMNQQ